MEKSELAKKLASGIEIIKFMKKDGTERVMKCTRNSNLIPVEHQPKGETQQITESTDNIRVFDVEKQAWRSFNYSSLKV